MIKDCNYRGSDRNMSDEKSMSYVSREISAAVSRIADSDAVQISANIFKSAMPRVLILTLDISGSMGGGPIEGGKYGLIKALRGAIASFDNIVVILYNHNITIYDIDKKNIEYVINQLERVRADGYTDFIKLFAAITAKKNYYKDKYNCFVDITVSIFTDGQHYVGDDVNNDRRIMLISFEQFKKSMHDADIKASGGNITVVALGYSSQNDVNMLGRLAEAGITKGKYKYACNPREIAEIMNPSELLNNAACKIIIVSPDGAHTDIPIELVKNSQGNGCETAYSHTGCSFFPQGLLKDGDRMFMERDGTKREIFFHINNDMSITERVSLSSQYCRKELSAVIINMAELSNDETLNSSKKILDELNKFIETIWILVQRTKDKRIRQSLIPEIKANKDQIKDIYNTVCNSIKKSLSNEDRSKLLSTGYALNGRFGDKLTDRVIKNASKFKEEDEKIESISHKIDPSKFPTDLDLMACFITLSTWLELIVQGDILCMTGFMSRSATAIVDSSKIDVEKIFSPTCNMSYSVFLETLMAELDKNKDTQEQVHGGFSFNFNGRNQSGILTALSNEKINFVFPLYICKEHWSIASILTSRILGWIATLDWAGYNFDQIKTIPFVVVKYMVNQLSTGVTESNIQMFFNASRVAHQLILDYRMKSIKGDLDNWIQSPLYRTGSDISDISIFLVKLLFQPEKCVLDNAFWLSVIEEIHRRSLLKQSRSLGKAPYNKDDMIKHFNLDPFIKKTALEKPKVSDRLIELLNAKSPKGTANTNETKETKETKVDTVIKFDSKTFETTDAMMSQVIDSLEQCKEQFDFMFIIKAMYEWMQSNNMPILYEKLDENYGSVTQELIDAFSSLTFSKYDIKSLGVSDRNLYAMFIQNNDNIQHANLKTSVENKTYVGPFSINSNEIVQRMVDGAIKTKQDSLTTNVERNRNSQCADIFIRTTDIRIAAGIIFDMCSNMGCSIFCDLYEALQKKDPDTWSFIAKLQLLIEGEYEGVRLYKDKNNMLFKWSPTHTNRYRIIESYKEIKKAREEEYDMEDKWFNIFKWVQSPEDGVIRLRKEGELNIKGRKRVNRRNKPRKKRL